MGGGTAPYGGWIGTDGSGDGDGLASALPVGDADVLGSEGAP